MRSNKRLFKRVFFDFFIVGASVVVALYLYNSGIFEGILNSSLEYTLLGTFVSGIFFTSVFTIAISGAAFFEILGHSSLIQTMIVGASGAVVGDLLIFTFVRKRVSVDAKMLCSIGPMGKVCMLLEKRTFRWLTPLIGGLVIASPLPDEIGLAMLGLSKLKLSAVIPLSFIFNAIGIFLISLFV